MRRVRAFPQAGPLQPPPPGHSWEGLMSLAILRARAAGQAGEVPVGAVVCAPDGAILSACANASLGTSDACGHAEILAIREACGKTGNFRLEGCTLIVTLEPCPMCAGAVREARLSGLVFGAADELAGAICSRAEFLALAPGAHRTWHMGGVLATECASLLAGFFANLRKGAPFAAEPCHA